MHLMCVSHSYFRTGLKMKYILIPLQMLVKVKLALVAMRIET